jgi:hypothetical protein
MWSTTAGWNTIDSCPTTSNQQSSNQLTNKHGGRTVQVTSYIGCLVMLDICLPAQQQCSVRINYWDVSENVDPRQRGWYSLWWKPMFRAKTSYTEFKFAFAGWLDAKTLKKRVDPDKYIYIHHFCLSWNKNTWDGDDNRNMTWLLRW